MDIIAEGQIHFSDPTYTFEHTSLSLEDAIRKLIRRAKDSISIVSFSLPTFNPNWYLYDIIDSKIKSGVKLNIYGNRHSEVHRLVSRFRHLGARGFCWKSDDSNGLFHIKAIIIDDLHVYFGSANLSENSIKNSAEIGFISSNSSICYAINNYLSHLEISGKLELV